MKRLGRAASIWALALAIVPTPVSARRPPKDILLFHGHFFTGDSDRPWAEAVLIHDGQISAVGSDAQLAGKYARRAMAVDIGGRMAMAGINDAHDHPGGTPFGIVAATRQAPQADPPLSDVADAVRAAAAKAPRGRWIEISAGASVMRDAAKSRAAMDEAGGGHPVMLVAWWGHGLIANTAGQAQLGLGDASPDPPGGSLDRDSQGRFTGKLNEYAGTAALRRLTSAISLDQRVADVRHYADQRLREGTTSVQVMASDQRPATFLETMTKADIPMRVRLIRFPIPAEDGEAPGPDDKAPIQVNSLLRIDGIKYVLDGSPIEQFAYQSKDYPERPGWRGRPNFDIDFLDARLREALAGRQQLALHVVGDAMAVQVLDEMERMAPAQAWRPLRVRLEHANGIVGAQIDRASRLGIVIAQPRPYAPIRDWLAAGIPVAYGSDMAFDPWSTFARMVAPDNKEAISREQAIHVLTTGPAFAEFREKDVGRIAPGMVADLAVLSQDVTTAPVAELAQTHSVLTIVDGEVAYADSAAFPALASRHDAR